LSSAVLDNSAAIQLTRDGADPEYAWGPHYAPELIDLEYANTLRKLVLRGELDDQRASARIATWSASNLIRCSHPMLLGRIWDHRGNITPYDASYVALAELLEIPLLTADRRLAKAAEPYCQVVLVGD
jgi:predicted nucleic acid-binding protein